MNFIFPRTNVAESTTIRTIIRKFFFSGHKSLGRRFHETFSSLVSSDDEKEIPRAMLGIVVVAIFAALKEWSEGRDQCTTQDFVSAEFSDEYNLHMNLIQSKIHKEDGSGKLKYHALMSWLYREASTHYTIPPDPTWTNSITKPMMAIVITHPGEVNGARYMPQNLELLVTKAVMGEVLVFDRMKHVWFVLESQQGWTYIRRIRGYDWFSVLNRDCKAYSKKNSMIQPTTTFRGHTSVTGYKISQEQTPDDQENGPPELLFVHRGHTPRPTNFCWEPEEMEN
ncbi:hypothetical protein F5880DRAFT_1504736 [Lentinula raphanica]|nr:hypothetical protein F5880DRAFT_1504736 [Lentinula raphanica]